MLLFDIETDNLLDKLTKVHCLVTLDTDTGEIKRYHGDSLQDGLEHLWGAEEIGGHNVIKFDIPALNKVFDCRDCFLFTRVYDTLVTSRLAFADIKINDVQKFKSGEMPGRLLGSHSLEAWGWRLGEHKGNYGSQKKDASVWQEWTQELEDYCEQDVKVAHALYNLLEAQALPQMAVQLEHDFATIIARQERRGVCFDHERALMFLADLLVEWEKLGRKLKAAFGSWEVPLPDFIPKRDNRTKGYKVGVPVKKSKIIEFNPASRDHIANRLIELYGWAPKEFTENGKPKVDERVLAKLNYPEVPLLMDYLLVSKRISQLAEGDNAWLKLERTYKYDLEGKDLVHSRIHGSVNTCGAVTGRCTHSNPNLAQVPRVGTKYGKECRSLFIATPGMKLIGCDASSLELRCLAHYMAKWDQGAYAKMVVEGNKDEGTDVHSINQRAAGLPDRDSAKTFVYSLIYGAGDDKIGSIIKKGPRAGRELRERFLKNLPALGSLVNAVQATVKKRGYLIGLDGRHLRVRSPHAALNTLLQSAGALVMKQALIEADLRLRILGLVPIGLGGNAYEFVLNVHDEMELEARTGIDGENLIQIGSILKDSIRTAGEYFKLNCALDGEYKIGDTWADTH
jgi:DNA polymerase I-like protein with 3'-5' exonuclease and polymerase domains